jgi:uncharacterized protein YkuJ
MIIIIIIISSIECEWFDSVGFAAEAFGLPLLPPSANKGTNFSQGANFAVMGATALDLKYFKDNNVWSIPPFNTSMNVQLQWFDEVKQTICSSPQGPSISNSPHRHCHRRRRSN